MADFNFTWDWSVESDLLSALAGSGLGGSIKDAWPELVRRKKISVENIRRYLRIEPSDVMAEIGGGMGIVGNLLAPEVTRYVNIDISASFQRIAKATSTANNIEFVLIPPGDLTAVRGKSINKFYSEACFIHLNLYDIYNYATQIFEILPFGGWLAFDFANADCTAPSPSLTKTTGWIEHFPQYMKDRKAVVQLLCHHSPNSIQRLLTEIGFSVEAIYFPKWEYTFIVSSKS
jgi:hypothetical protein